MTDYNNGDWWGWNGGECPVHPKSLVTALEDNGARWTANAEDCDWQSKRGAFRVIKAYLEPREWWLRLDARGNECGTDRVIGPPPPNWNPDLTIRVREVTE